jgi:ABC-type phosphate transport system substrate-binding protein
MSKRNNYNIKRIAYRGLLTFLLVAAVSIAKAQQSLSVIANQKGSPASLSLNELRTIFMGEKQRWGNGTKIIIALIKTNNPLGITISKKVFDMVPDELNKYWLALVFQGKVSAPTFFNSVSDLQNFVSQNPGAIGIVDQPVNTDEIKTLVVDGKKIL